MRLLQLFALLAVLTMAVRGDVSLTGTVSIFEFNPDIVLFHSDSECSGGGGAFALCSAGFSDGTLTLSVEASGDGCDGCSPTFGAENTALATFTDQITFYGPPGGTAAVTWFIQHGDSVTGQVGLFDLVLPTTIQFNLSYDILLSLSGFEAAFGNLSNADSNSETIEGFLLFDTSNPACSAITLGLLSDGADPSCGTPEDVTVHTQSGFLYGGHVPEPSTLLLLATGAGITLLLFRRRMA